MKDLMGIINLSENESKIEELTQTRPLAAIPIIGRYRVIDFVLSNMVNAGIRNVGIFSHGKSRSLIDHLGKGKEWDLDRKRDGLFIFNPMNCTNDKFFRRGDIENFKDHIDYITRSSQKYVLLSKSNYICSIDYDKVFEAHKRSGREITIVYKNVKNANKNYLGCDILNIDNSGKLITVGRNTEEIGELEDCNISMEMYIMKKELLLDFIKNSISLGDAESLKEAIFYNLKDFDVNTYRYEGYMKCVNSTINYYQANMEMLDLEVQREIFYGNNLIYTKVKDEPPTKYAEGSKVKNSLIANGCVIEGEVENSVIGRGVKINKGSIVKNSIVMQKGIVGENTKLEHVIIDKNVEISNNKTLGGDTVNPLVIKKNLKI